MILTPIAVTCVQRIGFAQSDKLELLPAFVLVLASQPHTRCEVAEARSLVRSAIGWKGTFVLLQHDGTFLPPAKAYILSQLRVRAL